MGKVMQLLNRLRYELRFIASSERCLQTSVNKSGENENKELQDILPQSIISKRESLPNAVWNATWAIEEVEALFTTSKHPLCLNGKPNNQSTISHAMFFSIYIDKVQQYLADLYRACDALMAPLAQLAHIQSGVMPSSFQRWQSQTLPFVIDGKSAGVWGDLDQAVADHTRSWQQLLEQCGLAAWDLASPSG